MAKLTWDELGERLFETGVSHGVYFPVNSNGTYGAGIAWNGLSAVKESHSGGDENAIFADNGKYVALTGTEEFEFTIEAYQCPKEFEECVGVSELGGMFLGTQKRRRFGFSYQTLIGNDKDGIEHGEKIHLVYGAMAKESDKDHETVNDNPDAMTLSWECTTTPVTVPGFKPTAHLTIDSTKVDQVLLNLLKETIYGTSVTDSRFLMPNKILELFSNVLNRFTVVPLFDGAYPGTYESNEEFKIDEETYPELSTIQSGVRVNGRNISGVVHQVIDGNNKTRPYLALLLVLDYSLDDNVCGAPAHGNVDCTISHVAQAEGGFSYEDLSETVSVDSITASFMAIEDEEHPVDSGVTKYKLYQPIYVDLTNFVRHPDTGTDYIDDQTYLTVGVYPSSAGEAANVAKWAEKKYCLGGITVEDNYYVHLDTD